MGTLIKALVLLFLTHTLHASDMLNGEYKIRATVQESDTNAKYPFRMNLSTQNNNITGDINYYNDKCSGTITGRVLSSGEIKLFETITQGKNICDNGIYIYDLKHQIISKSSSYTLEQKKHSVTINEYSFIPNPKSWNNILLKEQLAQLEIDIDELKNDINITRQFIGESEKRHNESKYYLEHNSTHINGECITPPLEPKPKPFLDTQEKAKHYALAYCSVSFGCRVGVELARDQLDTAAKRFLGSQGCTMMVRTYQKDNTLLGETAFNLLDAVSYAGCKDDGDGFLGGLMQGGSCIVSATTRLARVSQYIGCIDYRTEEFHKSYLDWKNTPENKKMKCDSHLKVVGETPKIVAKYNAEISKVENEIDAKNTKLNKLNDELQKLELLREKQSELTKKLKNV